MQRNPVAAVAALVHRLDQTASDQAVVTVGRLRVGERANVVPPSPRRGSRARAVTDDVVAQAGARVDRLVEETAGAGVIVVTRVPLGVNDPAAPARRAHEAVSPPPAARAARTSPSTGCPLSTCT
jgi:hippurate hydrolase